jgi:hypothetical protein
MVNETPAEVAMQELMDFLKTLPPGPVRDSNVILRLEALLAAAWEGLRGGHDGGMVGYKLLSRMEDVKWSPPVLTFTIERHGGTVLGSTYAKLQTWHIDLSTKTASFSWSGRRQIRPRQPPLDVTQIAQEIEYKIRAGEPDPRLQWRKDGKAVRVLTSRILPRAPKQTTEGRRKRLLSKIAEDLRVAGWEDRGAGWFRRPQD